MKPFLIMLVALAAYLGAAGARGEILVDPSATIQDCEGCPELVTLPSGLIIGATLVTVDQFARFADDTGFEGKGCTLFDAGKPSLDPDADWRNPGFEQTGDHPVVCVNWLEATAYADWLSEKTGQSYRLPTLEESQEAAAGGTSSTFFWGEDPNEACAHASVAEANYKAQYPTDPRNILTCDDGYTYTSPVKAFPPNAYGVYDAVGNAWQWTNSCLNGDCANAVMRGGGWNVPNPKYFKISESFGDRILLRNHILGFRVMRD